MAYVCVCLARRTHELSAVEYELPLAVPWGPRQLPRVVRHRHLLKRRLQRRHPECVGSVDGS